MYQDFENVDGLLDVLDRRYERRGEKKEEKITEPKFSVYDPDDIPYVESAELCGVHVSVAALGHGAVDIILCVGRFRKAIRIEDILA